MSSLSVLFRGMSELVDKVARAIAPDILYFFDGEDKRRTARPDFYDACVGATDKVTLEKIARAAIEAMREPTQEMVQARIDAYPGELRVRDYDKEVWRTMIGAALAAPVETANAT